MAMKGGAMLGMYENGEVNRQEIEAACGDMQGRISDDACQAELYCKELREQLQSSWLRNLLCIPIKIPSEPCE